MRIPNLSLQFAVSHPVRGVRACAEALAAILFVVADIADEPAHIAILFKGQHMGANPVEEPAVVADDSAQPAKFSSASSSARSVLTSMSLVGSSSSITLAPSVSILARCTRLRSPPESVPTFFC